MPRVRSALWICVIGLVIGAAALAEAQTPVSARDSNRVYRLQFQRSADTAYTSSLRRARLQLRERLDSLQHEFEGLGLDAPDRVDLVRELRALISSLGDLDQLEQHGRVRFVDPSMAAEKARTLAQQARTFGPMLRRSMQSLQPGWIGINAQGTQQRIVRNDSVYLRYFNYPQVISVEPSSPAERAGISRGDQLIAYEGADLRDHEINLTKLLQPSRRISVTIRRDGEERDYDVVVAKAPPQIEALRGFSSRDVAVDSMPFALAMPRTPVLARTMPQVRIFDGREAGVVPVLGAKLVAITDESLGRIFGVSSGVLVTEVFSDPAESSGLRGGDVISKADGRDITDVAQLRRIVAAHGGDRNVELEIVRQKRTRAVTLRW
ncbi:MAG TPA: PDZ domain-containing protein [Gemmatimonadaceae bacterium]